MFEANNIKEVEEWIQHNFIFNKQLVYYRLEGNLTDLPELYKFDKFTTDKSQYENPRVAMITILIGIGAFLQEQYSQSILQAIANGVFMPDNFDEEKEYHVK